MFDSADLDVIRETLLHLLSCMGRWREVGGTASTTHNWTSFLGPGDNWGFPNFKWSSSYAPISSVVRIYTWGVSASQQYNDTFSSDRRKMFVYWSILSQHDLNICWCCIFIKILLTYCKLILSKIRLNFFWTFPCLKTKTKNTQRFLRIF